MNAQPTVVVLGTGGTIAGLLLAGEFKPYQAAQVSVDQLMKAVPSTCAFKIECEQVAQLDSKDMSFAVWRQLALRAAHHAQRAHVQGVVITHGTDTVEETAYFLHRVLPQALAKPVVLVGAMRPFDAPDFDGLGNLTQALSFIEQPHTQGVWVVMHKMAFSAPNVGKMHPTDLNAFGKGNALPLAHWRMGAWCFDQPKPWHNAPKPLVQLSDLPVDTTQWPRVDIVVSHAGQNGQIVQALQAIGTRGIVVAGTGHATLHQALEAALVAAQAVGVRVFVCAHHPLEPYACNNPRKARIDLMLQLMVEKP
jgi:L-asparaginase